MKSFDEDGGFFNSDDEFCSHCGTPHYRRSSVAGLCAPCLSGDEGVELESEYLAHSLYGISRHDMGLVR